MTDHDEFADIPVTHLDAAVIQNEQDVLFGWTPRPVVHVDVPDDDSTDDA